MANEVINAYQTWRDKKGKVLAAGGLRIYVNRTNQLGTAFSDSALTIPQEVDPYRLDNYGRSQADLRWSGLRTVEVYDANDTLIRTLNDAVTLVDTSVFAQNFASVAAMVAETSLEVGDFVETQSYNADQNQGGARYLIVAAATGTDDGYTYHDLDNGLQAELLDLEANKNFFVGGAVGDGATDDSAPVQAVMNTGGNIECSNGTFRCENISVDVAFRLFGNGTMILSPFASFDMLTMTGDAVTVIIDGVTMDGNSANQAAEAARSTLVNSLDSSAGARPYLFLNDVTFQNGNEFDFEGVGNDDGADCIVHMKNVNFIGGQEATDTPYVPVYCRVQDGQTLILDNGYFDLDADPATTGGRGGVELSSSATLVNASGSLTVSDTTFNRVGAVGDATTNRAAVFAEAAANVQVHGNRFISPQYAAVAWEANCAVVSVTENIATGLTGANKLAAIGCFATADAAPGDNWQIALNELVDIAGIAISLDGSSAGVDASNVQITDNLIDSPTGQALLLHNIDTLTIDDNEIDMALVTSVNAIEVNTDGLSGQVGIEGNTIINVDGAAINATVTDTGTYTIDGNTIEACVDGIDVQNSSNAYVTNNKLEEVSGALITLGTLTNAKLEGNSYTGTAPTTYAQNAGSITNLTVGENLWDQVDSSITNIAGATIAVTARYHEITSTTTITGATFTGNVAGFVVVLKATVSVTVNDSATINLSAAYNMTAGDTLTLAWDGTAFNEISRSVN